jgi:hypothetical protein
VDLRALPLIERKESLRESFADTQSLIYASGIVGAGEWVFETCLKSGSLFLLQ